VLARCLGRPNAPPHLAVRHGRQNKKAARYGIAVSFYSGGAVVAADAGKALQIMKQHEFGKEASVIGKIVEEPRGKAILKTAIGGKRIIDMLAGEQLPRIC